MMAEEKKVSLVFKKDAGVIAWPCAISVPLTGGGRQDQMLTARFKVVSDERFKQLVGDPLQQLTRPEEITAQQGDIPLLQEVLVGFSDLKDESGASVDDAVAIETFLALPYAVRGLAVGYVEMVGRRLPKN